MRLAVVQHLFRVTPEQDLDALSGAVERAAAAGADAVLVPGIHALRDGPLADGSWRRIEDAAPGKPVFAVGDDSRAADPSSPAEIALLGHTVFLRGDACVDPEVHAGLASHAVDTLVLAPGSESELQAEAVLELGLALSTSLAPLVLIVEPDGAALGEAGHGGSAIMQLGDVRAEALAGDDLLLADLEFVAGPPSPRDALPEIPPVLAQRLHAHRARSSCDAPGHAAGSHAAAW